MEKTNNGEKKWSVTDLESKQKVGFQAVWEEKDEQNTDGLENPEVAKKEIECAFIEITSKDAQGNDVKLKFNYLDLYGFVYFIGNEELRRQLALRYERQIVYMPYEVTFKIDEEEKAAGIAKRRITLSIDEVAMAMVRARAMVLEGSSQAESDEQLKQWRENKINNLPTQIKERIDFNFDEGQEIELLDNDKHNDKKGNN